MKMKARWGNTSTRNIIDCQHPQKLVRGVEQIFSYRKPT